MISSTPLVRLSNGNVSIGVHPQGGQLVDLNVGGRQVLQSDEAQLKRSGVPICFPHFGPLSEGQLKVGERRYPSPQHGFWRNQTFSVTPNPGENSITANFRTTADTKKQFPFEVDCTAVYTLTRAGVRILLRIANLGDVPVPVAPGLHPYFKVHRPEAVWFSTNTTHGFDNTDPANEAAFTRVLALKDSRHLIRDGELDDQTPRYRVIGAPNLHMPSDDSQVFISPGTNDYIIRMNYNPKLFPYLILWRENPDSPYICVECGNRKDALNSGENGAVHWINTKNVFETAVTIVLE